MDRLQTETSGPYSASSESVADVIAKVPGLSLEQIRKSDPIGTDPGSTIISFAPAVSAPHRVRLKTLWCSSYEDRIECDLVSYIAAFAENPEEAIMLGPGVSGEVALKIAELFVRWWNERGVSVDETGPRLPVLEIRRCNDEFLLGLGGEPCSWATVVRLIATSDGGRLEVIKAPWQLVCGVA